MNIKPLPSVEEVVEHFASQEHIRWAKWQNYLHSFLTWSKDLEAWFLPHEQKYRWQRQIQTPYSMLSEKEQESDREQVRPYINYITQRDNQAYTSLVEGIKAQVKDINGESSVFDDFATDILENVVKPLYGKE